MMLKGGIGAVALTSILLSSAAWAQEKIKVGVTATLEGTYTVLGEDGIRGFKAAVNKYGPKAGGKELEFVIASTDATPDSGGARGEEAHRAGPRADPDLAAVGRRRHRGQELLQDPSGADVHQRRFRRAGNDFPGSVAEFLPLQHGRRAVASGPRRLCLQHQGLQEDRDRWRRLFLRLHAGLRPDPRILRGRRTGDEPPMGAARDQGFCLDDRGAARGRRRDLPRPRRRRRGQFPQPVRASRRQGASHGRLDHGRPDRAFGQGRREEGDDRHDRRERHGRHLGQRGLAGVREGLSGRHSRPRSASRARLCWRPTTTIRRWRCTRRSTRSMATSATISPNSRLRWRARARRSQRQDQPRRRSPGDRDELRHRSRRRRQGRLCSARLSRSSPTSTRRWAIRETCSPRSGRRAGQIRSARSTELSGGWATRGRPACSCISAPTVEPCRKLRDKSGRRSRDEPGRRGRPRPIRPRGDLQSEPPLQHPCAPRRAPHLSFVGRRRRRACFRRSLPRDQRVRRRRQPMGAA